MNEESTRPFSRRPDVNRLQAELEVVRARAAELEHQVATRTAALESAMAAMQHTRQELRAAQAQLIHQDKLASLGALTAGIAHEIKNPLNFITNFAEVNAELLDELRETLDGDPDPALTQELLEDLAQNAGIIREHGQRADRIVRSMMAHARDGAGEKETVDLNKLVAEHVDLAYHGKRAQTPGFTVALEPTLADEVGTVEVLPQALGRVVLNLVGNAFDAVQEAATQRDAAYAPRVTVTTRRTDTRVVIEVGDNGLGIPQGLCEKIFTPFFTTKPSGRGTGLGLSLSYDIVTQGHGGTLTVESTEGEGARFTIVLPAVSDVPGATSD
ncbi:MAG: ATP-binding protein [Bacteroidota bacterium]